MRTLIFAFFCMVMSVTHGSAEDNIPDLKGVWKIVNGEGRTGGGDTFKFGEVSSGEIEILNQDGATFSGVYRWEHPVDVDTMHDGKNVTNISEETFIGVVSWDNKSLMLVDHPDTTIWLGKLVNMHTIEMVVGESGRHAMVGRAILVR